MDYTDSQDYKNQQESPHYPNHLVLQLLGYMLEQHIPAEWLPSDAFTRDIIRLVTSLNESNLPG